MRGLLVCMHMHTFILISSIWRFLLDLPCTNNDTLLTIQRNTVLHTRPPAVLCTAESQLTRFFHTLRCLNLASCAERSATCRVNCGWITVSTLPSCHRIGCTSSCCASSCCSSFRVVSDLVRDGAESIVHASRKNRIPRFRIAFVHTA